MLDGPKPERIAPSAVFKRGSNNSAELSPLGTLRRFLVRKLTLKYRYVDAAGGSTLAHSFDDTIFFLGWSR